MGLGLLGIASIIAAAGLYKKWTSNSSSSNNSSTSATSSTTDNDKAKNVYNYYTNDSTNGTTLFNGQTQKKRTLFGNEGLS